MFSREYRLLLPISIEILVNSPDSRFSTSKLQPSFAIFLDAAQTQISAFAAPSLFAKSYLNIQHFEYLTDLQLSHELRMNMNTDLIYMSDMSNAIIISYVNYFILSKKQENVILKFLF